MGNFLSILSKTAGIKFGHNESDNMKTYSSEVEHDLRLLAEQDGIQKIVVGAVILNKEQDRVLFLKRHPSDFMPNLEELPSGGLHEGESFQQAVIREVQEETGLDVSAVMKYLTFFDYRSQKGRLTRQFNFLVSTIRVEPIVLSPTEHSSYTWRPLCERNCVSQAMQKVLEVLITGLGTDDLFRGE